MVRRTRYASDLLDALRNAEFRYSYSYQEMLLDDFQEEMIRNLGECRQRLWVAFGALMSRLSESHDEFDRRQVDEITPRTFSEVCTNEPESLVSEIHRLSLLLESPHSKPQDAVKIVITGVEGLTTRLWPSETNRANGVSRTLGDKRRSPNDLERRFAVIATPLWSEYRRPAAHEVDFECSFHEARLYLSGIRAMVDLAERIEETRRENRGNGAE